MPGCAGDVLNGAVCTMPDILQGCLSALYKTAALAHEVCHLERLDTRQRSTCAAFWRMIATLLDIHVLVSHHPGSLNAGERIFTDNRMKFFIHLQGQAKPRRGSLGNFYIGDFSRIHSGDAHLGAGL